MSSHRWHHSGPALGAFAVLVVLAAFTLLASAHIMSNGCIVGSEQQLCPISGPDWARPVPVTLIGLGVVAAFLGLAAGRPVRTPAVVTGYALFAAGLVVTLLIG